MNLVIILLKYKKKIAMNIERVATQNAKVKMTETPVRVPVT